MQGMFSRKPVLMTAVGLGVVLVCVSLWEPTEATSPQPSTTVLAGNDESYQETGVGFALLKGRWRRPDGGYVLDIRNVDSIGKMDAAYFNPNPIKVSKAEATREGAITKVFIELRDTGYPGCTFILTYDPQTDQLRGVYFQAAIQQNFDVIFFRIK
jgi:hypothetical protein